MLPVLSVSTTAQHSNDQRTKVRPPPSTQIPTISLFCKKLSSRKASMVCCLSWVLHHCFGELCCHFGVPVSTSISPMHSTGTSLPASNLSKFKSQIFLFKDQDALEETDSNRISRLFFLLNNFLCPIATSCVLCSSEGKIRFWPYKMRSINNSSTSLQDVAGLIITFAYLLVSLSLVLKETQVVFTLV